MSNVANRVQEGEDIIDSRDIIERIEELKGERPDMPSEPKATDYPEDGSWSEDQEEELNKLVKLAEEVEGCSDWQHGEALIADSYFETYAEQLADDIGAISSDAKWPLNHIDWKAAADELKQDYTSVTFGETEYWVRS